MITNQIAQTASDPVIPEELRSGVRVVRDMTCANSANDSKRLPFWTPVDFQD